MRKRWLPLLLALLLIVTLLPGCGRLETLSARIGQIAQRLEQEQQTGQQTQQQQQAAPTATVAPPSPTQGELASLESMLQGIYERVSPSVVSIEVIQRLQGQQGMPGWSPFSEEQQVEGSGSGFVWDTQGHIVTNNHVVEDAEKIRVTFSDGSTVMATVVGTDPDSDLAVLKVDRPAEQLQPVELADSTQVKVGSLVVAIGQPFGLENSMTVGIVSAIGRSMSTSEDGTSPSYSIPDVIQTDAAINPGNSGGVLLNSSGQVIGVPTAIISAVRSSSGVGFAVPSAIVRKVVPALIAQGYYEHPRLGIVGTSMDPDIAEAMGLPATQRGALVVEVTAGSAADKAGLRGSDRTVEIDGQEQRIGGDVIIAADGQPIRSFDDLVSFLARDTVVGQQIQLTILRRGSEQQVSVTLEARPRSTEATEEQPQSVSGTAWLGVSGITLTRAVAEAAGLTANQRGVLVQDVVVDSPADRAGLRGSSRAVTVGGQQVLVGGDVIYGWNGMRVQSMEQLQLLLMRSRPGDEVTLNILRDGERLEVRVTLGTKP